MNWKRHFAEAATLILAAIVCATVSNAFASRERKMQVVGKYPNALKVPNEAPAQPIAPLPETTTTTTSAPAIAPVTATTTIVPTATATTIAPITTKKAPTPTTTTIAATPPPPAPPSIDKFQPHPDKPYIEIGYDDVASLFKAGTLFLDARRTNIYEQGHVAGAQTFSVWEGDVDDKVRKLWEQRQDPKEQALPIVVYCSGGDCEDSHMLAGKLYGALFNNVYVYKDGFPDWQKHGGAAHTGSNP